MSATQAPPSPGATSPRDAKVWDRIADKYAEKPVADEAAYQTKLEVTRGYLRPDMTMLEFGCGTGSTAIVHAPRVRHIQGIDISARMIEIAREKAAAAAIRNVAFEQATLAEYAAPDESFDIVLGMSILHLVDDRDEAIGRVHRLLKPGGLFVSTTPCLGGYLRFAPMRIILPVLRWFGRVPTVRFFTEADLRESLQSAGFEIDHEWKPGPARACFIVAKKPE